MRKFWYALLIGIAHLWVGLPYRWQMCAGRGLGRLSFYLLKRRRQVAARNLAACFPDFSAVEHKALLKKTFLSAGMAMMEALIAWFMPERCFRRIHFKEKGIEYLATACEQAQGAILCSGHMMCLEIVGRALGQQYPFSVVYKPARQAGLQRVFEEYRARHYQKILAHRDIKQVVRLLRAGEPIWYAPDQDFGRKPTVFADFLGVETATLTATATLARLGKASVVPIFFHRLPKDKGYEIEVLPPLTNFPSGDDQADAERYNKILADYVKRYPDQYHWLHRRFKTRPLGEAPFYI